MQRLILLIVATFIFMAVPATAAGTAADMWRVSQTSGDVRVIHNRLQPAAARIDAALSPGDVVMTGATGRATLTRGGDYIVIAPGSRLLLPANSQQKGMTSLIQEIGTMLFKVRSTGKPHFRVDTPMLAAVVKGTTFTVIVGVDRSAVQVIEGAVQVSAVQGGMSHLVEGGKTVFIANDNPASLVVADGATLLKTSGGSDVSVTLGGSGNADLATVANLSEGLVRADLTAAPVRPVADTVAPIADAAQSPATGTISVADVVETTTGAPAVTAVVSGV
ncbi:MAG TPA: FecR family protein, partial [Sphingomicrobium sp.]|nr:FecR family protein [Sphingomicrobium sp.]